MRTASCHLTVLYLYCFLLPLFLPAFGVAFQGVFCPTVFSLLWFSLSLYQYSRPTALASSCGMTQTFVSHLVLVSHQTASCKSLWFSEGGTITQIGVFFPVHRLWPAFWALSTGALLLQHTLEGSCRRGGSMGLALRPCPQGWGAWVWCTQSQWVDFLLSTDSRNQVPYLSRSDLPPPQSQRSHLSTPGADGENWVSPAASLMTGLARWSLNALPFPAREVAVVG